MLLGLKILKLNFVSVIYLCLFQLNIQRMYWALPIKKEFEPTRNVDRVLKYIYIY
jgi:hypothetical protein